MPAWRSADVDDAGWDDLLAAATDAGAFQSAAWARSKRRGGWRAERLVAVGAGGRVDAAVQVLVRRVAGLALGWAPGGPVVGFPHADATAGIGALPDALRRARLAAARVDCAHPNVAPLLDAFERSFRRPRRGLNTGATGVVDLDGWRSRITAHHRREIRYASEHGLSVADEHHADGAGALAALSDALRSTKDLATGASEREIRDVLDAFGPNAMLVVARRDGTPVSAALVVRFAATAVLLTSATDAAGRDTRAGYAVFEAVLDGLRDAGASTFDVGGLVPGDARFTGVNRFKEGFGTTLVQRCGEWQWQRHPLGGIALDVGAARRSEVA